MADEKEIALRKKIAEVTEKRDAAGPADVPFLHAWVQALEADLEVHLAKKAWKAAVMVGAADEAALREILHDARTTQATANAALERIAPPPPPPPPPSPPVPRGFTWNSATNTITKTVFPPDDSAVAGLKTFLKNGANPAIFNFADKMRKQAIVALEDEASISVIAPSGSGKSQAGLAMQDSIRLVIVPEGGGAQYVNHAMQAISGELRSTLQFDLNQRNLADNCSLWNLQQNYPNEPMCSVGLLAHFLGKIETGKGCWDGKPVDEKVEPAWIPHNPNMKLLSITQVEFQFMSINELKQWVSQLGFHPVVILDELPKYIEHDENAKESSPPDQRGRHNRIVLQLLRNICRAAHIPIILMGTNTSVANLVDDGNASRKREGAAWTYLYNRLPKFAISEQQRQHLVKIGCEQLEEIFAEANPLLSTIALRTLDKETGAISLVSALEKIRQALITLLQMSKGVFGKPETLAAQFAMHLEVAYERCLSNSTVNSHFARLTFEHQMEDEHFVKVELADKQLLVAGKLLKDARVCFNRRDLLLKLACSGSDECPAFQDKSGQRLSVVQAFMEVQPILFPVPATLKSDAASNDGELFEAVMRTAIEVASHGQTLDGPGLTADEALRLRCAELHLEGYFLKEWHVLAPSMLGVELPRVRYCLDQVTAEALPAAFWQFFGCESGAPNKKQADGVTTSNCDPASRVLADYDDPERRKSSLQVAAAVADPTVLRLASSTDPTKEKILDEFKNRKDALPTEEVAHSIKVDYANGCRLATIMSTKFGQKYDASNWRDDIQVAWLHADGARLTVERIQGANTPATMLVLLVFVKPDPFAAFAFRNKIVADDDDDATSAPAKVRRIVPDNAALVPLGRTEKITLKTVHRAIPEAAIEFLRKKIEDRKPITVTKQQLEIMLKWPVIGLSTKGLFRDLHNRLQGFLCKR